MLNVILMHHRITCACMNELLRAWRCAHVQPSSKVLTVRRKVDDDRDEGLRVKMRGVPSALITLVAPHERCANTTAWTLVHLSYKWEHPLFDHGSGDRQDGAETIVRLSGGRARGMMLQIVLKTGQVVDRIGFHAERVWKLMQDSSNVVGMNQASNLKELRTL
jgi:hypothetical protein